MKNISKNLMGLVALLSIGCASKGVKHPELRSQERLLERESHSFNYDFVPSDLAERLYEFDRGEIYNPQEGLLGYRYVPRDINSNRVLDFNRNVVFFSCDYMLVRAEEVLVKRAEATESGKEEVTTNNYMIRPLGNWQVVKRLDNVLLEEYNIDAEDFQEYYLEYHDGLFLMNLQNTGRVWDRHNEFQRRHNPAQ